MPSLEPPARLCDCLVSRFINPRGLRHRNALTAGVHQMIWWAPDWPRTLRKTPDMATSSPGRFSLALEVGQDSCTLVNYCGYWLYINILHFAQTRSQKKNCSMCQRAFVFVYEKCFLLAWKQIHTTTFKCFAKTFYHRTMSYTRKTYNCSFIMIGVQELYR